MTTDPTPHTERAAAAAAEICCRIEDIGIYHREEAVTAIIAKHFNDDAAKLDGNAHQSLVNAQAADNWRNECAQLHEQHDALRLAAGRALAALEKAIGLNYVPEHRQDHEWHEALEALEKEHTALSAALAGDKGKETK